MHVHLYMYIHWLAPGWCVFVSLMRGAASVDRVLMEVEVGLNLVWCLVSHVPSHCYCRL